jgi:hypothetical protein
MPGLGDFVVTLGLLVLLRVVPALTLLVGYLTLPDYNSSAMEVIAWTSLCVALTLTGSDHGGPWSHWARAPET